jgi:hypothetical protein
MIGRAIGGEGSLGGGAWTSMTFMSSMPAWSYTACELTSIVINLH